jgi:LmbE family N-acetylglucosaminyl deacetylase
MADRLDAVPERVLAVYAHPDDPEVSCGGTLARWTGAGAQVHVVICTTGDKGTTDPSTDPADLVRRRLDEMEAAAAVLGLAGHHRLDHGDGELEEARDLRHQLVGLVRGVRPDALVCPDPTAVFFGQHYFNHRDHRAVGWAALDAVSPASGSPLYFPDAGPPHRVSTVYLSGTLQPDTWVDISTTIDAKVDALLCHASQLTGPPESVRTVVRQRAEEGGRPAGLRHAEAFRVLRFA